MCYFISIGIPEKQSGYVKQILSKNYEIEETKNKAFCKELSGSSKAYTVTKNGCSCDLYKWVEFPKEKLEVHKQHMGEMDKFETKNKLKNKIKRSINTAIKASQIGLKSDLVRDLGSFLEQLKTMTIAVHWYKGNIENEEINFSGKMTLTIQELIKSPASIKPDIIYKIECLTSQK